jgi:hypothetical protein
LEGFRLRLTFTDGLVREVDLSDDLWGRWLSRGGTLTTSGRYASITSWGTVVWPNDFDLDPDVLHGDYEPIGRPAAQASH